MELDALVGGVIELAEKLGVPTPAMQTVYACASFLRDRRRQPA
jgi:ketopantoate reductase